MVATERKQRLFVDAHSQLRCGSMGRARTVADTCGTRARYTESMEKLANLDELPEGGILESKLREDSVVVLRQAEGGPAFPV